MADHNDGTPMLRLNGHDAQQSRPLISTSPMVSATQHQRDGSQSKLLPATTYETSFSHSPQFLADPQKSCLPTSIHQENRPHMRSFWWNTSHLAACVGVVGLIISSILVPVNLVWLSPDGDNLYGSGFCDSGGNFHLVSGSSFWAPSQVFEITVAFGNFSFSNAKLIDVMWDVIVGRGGQALLTFICYRVFSLCLTRLMEQSSVTISTFQSISLRGSMSVTSILELIKDFLTHTTTRARFCIAWMIFASLYALFFQTLLSAMTGYVAQSSPYVLVPGGVQQPWSSLTPVTYIIHDGWRLGLSGDYKVVDDYVASEPYYASCYDDYEIYDVDSGSVDYYEWPEECQIIQSTTTYIEQMGSSPSNRTSTFINPKNYNLTIHLQAPTLDISVFSSPWTNSNLSLYTYLDGSQNVTYSAEYLQTNTTCSPEKAYHWGFSGLLLAYTIILTTIWAIGMFSMWLDAHFHSKLDFCGREQGTYRAALDFAMVLVRELDGTEDIDMLSDKAIYRKMRTGKRIATISHTGLVVEKATVDREMAPINMFAVMITALIFSIVELSFSGYLIYYLGDYFYPMLKFTVFASVWTLLITAFRIIMLRFQRNTAPETRAMAVRTMVVNAVTMIFWLANLVSLEYFLALYDLTGLGCAIVTFALLLWLVFLGLLVLDILTVVRIVKSDRMGYKTLVKRGGDGATVNGMGMEQS